MRYLNNILETVGKTPLIKINKLAGDKSALLLAKAEMLNPGGSIKDRMAIFMVERAEADGRLKPGGTIVENTSGNTGIGLAMAAAVKGYRAVFTMPDKMSSEKVNMLKAYGADVVVTPTDLPHDHPDSYYGVAQRVAKETPNSWYVNQYDEPSNIEAHYATTGPELWEETEGKLDYLVLGVGTGGTVTGAGRYLKEQAAKSGRQLRIIAAEPEGSTVFDTFYGNANAVGRIYKVEGIGHDYVPGCVDLSVIDEMRRVSDRDSFLTARRLAREEGIFAGGSAGSALYIALQVAREAGEGKTVVVILPDSGNRYLSKLYNDAWMRDLGFLDLDERLGRVRDLLQFKGCHVEFAAPDEPIRDVASRMARLGISQMPMVLDEGAMPLMIHEIDILQGLLEGKTTSDAPAKSAAHKLHGIVTLEDPISRLEKIFNENNVAVVVEGNIVRGIISKIDAVRYIAGRT